MTTSVVFQSFAEIKTKKNHQIAFVKSLQNVARTAASRRQQFNAPCVLMPSNLVSSYWLVAWSTTNKTIKVTHIQPVQQPRHGYLQHCMMSAAQPAVMEDEAPTLAPRGGKQGWWWRIAFKLL